MTPDQFANFCLNNPPSNINKYLSKQKPFEISDAQFRATLDAINDCRDYKKSLNGCNVVLMLVRMLARDSVLNKEKIIDLFSRLGESEMEIQLQTKLLDKYPVIIRNLISKDDIANKFSTIAAKACMYYTDIRERLDQYSISKIILKHYDNPGKQYDQNYMKRYPYEYDILKYNKKDIENLINICDDTNINNIDQKCQYGQLLSIVVSAQDVADKLNINSVKSMWCNKIEYNWTQQSTAVNKILLNKHADMFLKFTTREMAEIMLKSDLTFFYGIFENKHFEILAQADGQEYLKEMKTIINELKGWDKKFAQERCNDITKKIATYKNNIKDPNDIVQELNSVLENETKIPSDYVVQKIKILINQLDQKYYDNLKWNSKDVQENKEKFIANNS
ncbi:MAG: hypothetical protein HRT87_05295 [Legionellales bacterium]|nr:hypothetical protein [Legionellales bacterium]